MGNLRCCLSIRAIIMARIVGKRFDLVWFGLWCVRVRVLVCVRARARASALVPVCVCVCVFGFGFGVY